jgi:hypothetical protein
MGVTTEYIMILYNQKNKEKFCLCSLTLSCSAMYCTVKSFDTPTAGLFTRNLMMFSPPQLNSSQLFVAEFAKSCLNFPSVIV